MKNSTYCFTPKDLLQKIFSLRHVEVMWGNNNTTTRSFILHDHTSSYSLAKAIFKNQNYIIGQLRYFGNNLSRTSKQAKIYFMNCILIK